MKKTQVHFLLSIIIPFLVNSHIIFSSALSLEQQDHYKRELLNLFHQDPGMIVEQTKKYLVETQEALNLIINIKSEDRTFQNTAQPLDFLLAQSDLMKHNHVIGVLKLVSPSDEIRGICEENIVQIKQFFIEYFFNNPELYRVLKEYNEGNAIKEVLNDEQRYFLADLIKQFECNGLSLPYSIQQEIKNIKKELAGLEISFESNIANDTKTIEVNYSELNGLPKEFVAQLKRTKQGKYIVGVDYPTYFNVMENCTVEATRHSLFLAFENRAYPANEQVLLSMIAKRDQLAKLLGYSNFADLDLCNQMARNVWRVEQFLNDLQPKILAKETKEFEKLIAHLPAGVSLTVGKKLNAWDYAFVKAHYRKQFMQLDENEIAEYFSTDSTIDGLLKIYERFFSLRFKKVDAEVVWHEDVKLLQVFDKKNQLLGHIFLDLHPRPHKFTHACCVGIVPVIVKNEQIIPGSTIVITNFPKESRHKPALLKRNDVRTFFHEFGHALHWMLGRTELFSIDVKTDFVELPSQMLEEWLFDAAILKSVSKHYKTGKQLPDETIEKIIALKKFDSGSILERLLFLSHLSLDLFKDGDKKNPDKIFQYLSKKFRPNLTPVLESHFYASFTHLPDYAAKYYGYLWSKVFALDLFTTIKKHGLLNPEIGQKYIDEVLSKGGCQDPNILLKNFLGREPNQEAFLYDMGLV